jgi:hypothetical protein
MDADATALQNPTFTLKDKDGKAVRNVVSMCSNKLQQFGAYVEASIGRARERLFIESNEKTVDTGKLEEIGNAIGAQINQKRRKQGKWPLDSVIDQFNCRRGSSELAGAINLVTDENGVERLNIELVPWDPRWTSFIMGADEPEQSGREIEMKKDEIDSQPLAVEKGYICPSSKALQTEIWTKEDHLFYVNEKEAFSEPNPYGFVPVARAQVPAGSMLQDKGIEQYQGESYLYMLRDQIDYYNALLSILNTKGNQSIKPPIQVKGKLPEDAYESLTGIGRATEVDEVNAIQPVILPDLRESFISLLNEIKETLNESTLKQIALTDIPSGGVSTATLLTIVQGQGSLYAPRLGARGLIKQTMLEYIFKMIKALKLTSFTIGSSGNSKTYPIKVLDGQYDITYVYTNATAESESAQISQARIYKELGFDDETIFRDILKREDWKGDYAKMQRQKLRQYVPMLGVFDALMATSFLYKERGDDALLAELKISEATLGITAEQMKRGILPQMGNEQPIQVSENLPALESPQRQAMDAKNALATEEINAG